MCKKNHLGVCCAVRNYSLSKHGCEPNIVTINGKRETSFPELLPDSLLENLKNAGATVREYSRHKHGVGIISETVVSI
jgi:hypothetical protein